MKLFDFLKKPTDLNLPSIYQGIINKEEYNLVVKLALKYHKEKGIPIIRIGEGEIVADVEGEEHHRFLDNLVRLLAGSEREKWENIINEHFNKLVNNDSAYNYLFKDFDYALQYLRVLIKSADINIGENVNDFIFRFDFPGTKTFLVFDFEEQFRYIRTDEIKEWGKSTGELFDIGISNTPGDEIEIKECQFSDKFIAFVFFSGDYSASLMLDLENRANFSIGEYGSLIAIPTKGTAFTYPIESEAVLELVKAMIPTVENFYNEDPGNITTNFYWYYNKVIQQFPYYQEGGSWSIAIPNELIRIFDNK